MPVTGEGVSTLLDLVNAVAPDGKEQDIAEVLTQTNEVLDDMTFMNGNLLTGHRGAVRTVVPKPTWRAINEGVPVTKGGSTQIEESCGMLEDFSQCDRELALLSGNVDGFRLKEARPHVQGMANEMARTLFYGNANVNPKEFTGLASRFWTLDQAKNPAAANVIDAGGTGANLRSIWLVGWSESTITGIVPKNSKAGLEHEDATSHINGPGSGQTLQDANGNLFIGYRDHWTWRSGLFMPDWRYVVRIANIDLTTLTKDNATGADLVDLLIQAEETIQSLSGVRAAFYAPRAITSWARRQIRNNKNVNLTVDSVGGKRVTHFDEIPFRRVDQLNVAETRVTV